MRTGREVVAALTELYDEHTAFIRSAFDTVLHDGSASHRPRVRFRSAR